MENDMDRRGERNTRTGQTATTSEDQWNELIPGIPNDLTLNVIVPKLPWTDVLALPAVSRAWKRATESHQVYDARVRALSTETLFATVTCKFSGGCPPDGKHTVGLYCPRDKRGYALPPIPGVSSGIPYHCQCVALDGCLYVLGGTKDYCDFDSGSTKVYMLDVAGKKQWKQCADMHEPRMNFGASVMDGKVYVLGGVSKGRYSCKCEVYDPKLNAWSPMKSMPFRLAYHKVSSLGNKLYVFGGWFMDLPVPDRAEDGLIDAHNSSDDEEEDGLIDAHNSSDDEEEDVLIDPYGSSDDEAEDRLVDPSGNSNDEAKNGLLDPSGNSKEEGQDGLVDRHGSSDNEAEDRLVDPHGSTDDEEEDHHLFDFYDSMDDWADDDDSGDLSELHEDALFLEVYDPVNDEWTVFENWLSGSDDSVFVANGSFLVIYHTIFLQNPTRHEWAAFQQFSLTGLGPNDSTGVFPLAVVLLDGIDGDLIALVHWNNWWSWQWGTAIAIVRGQGFWENSQVDWEILTSCHSDRNDCRPFYMNPFFCRVDL